jgi:uncharacterized SAM-binding protein YcdF (DUF218 family)
MAAVTSRPTARRTRSAGLRRVVGAVVALTLLALFLLPAVVAARVVQVADRDERVSADAVVVLGAAQLDGEPGEVLQARLEQALALYEEGLAPTIVTTGGNQEGDRFTEAGSARDWLVERGVPAEAVVAVPEGRDTYDSLVPVAQLAQDSGWTGVLVVSDPWHVYRVRTMADDLGLPVAGASPTRTGPSNEIATRVVSYVARETGAVLVHHGTVLIERVGL